MEQEQLFAGQALVVVLDGLQDPGNAGRSCGGGSVRASGAIFLKARPARSIPKRCELPRIAVPRALSLRNGPALAACGVRRAPHALYAAVPARAGAEVRAVADVDLTAACALIIGNEAGASAPSGAAVAGKCVHPHGGSGIAQCRHGRRHPALRGAPPEVATMSLFDSSPPAERQREDGKRPLAERMRPTRLEDYIGRSIFSAGQATAPADRARPVDVDHSLGSAGRRQDRRSPSSSRV